MANFKAVTRLAAVALVVLTTVVIYSPAPAAACTCGFMPSVEDLDSSDVAFVGVVTDISRIGNSLIDAEFTFAVEHWIAFDGQEDPPDEVTISSSLQTSACGFNARTGERVALAAQRTGSVSLSGGWCGELVVGDVLNAIDPIQAESGTAVVAYSSDGAGVDGRGSDEVALLSADGRFLGYEPRNSVRPLPADKTGGVEVLTERVDGGLQLLAVVDGVETEFHIIDRSHGYSRFIKLSPSGNRVALIEYADDTSFSEGSTLLVFDTTSAERIGEQAIPPSEYEFWLDFAWLDDDHLGATRATGEIPPGTSEPLEILRAEGLTAVSTISDWPTTNTIRWGSLLLHEGSLFGETGGTVYINSLDGSDTVIGASIPNVGFGELFALNEPLERTAPGVEPEPTPLPESESEFEDGDSEFEDGAFETEANGEQEAGPALANQPAGLTVDAASSDDAVSSDDAAKSDDAVNAVGTGTDSVAIGRNLIWPAAAVVALLAIAGVVMRQRRTASV